jgi:hypothetical protein
MTQWEYLTRYLEAQVDKAQSESLHQRFKDQNLPRYTPENMIPELDSLGAAGWELVHMEPVPKVGGKGDLLFGGAARWSHSFFCVFKRPKTVVTAPPPMPQAQPTPPTSAPSDSSA